MEEASLDLAFTPEQDILRQEVRAWLQANVPAQPVAGVPVDEVAEARLQADWERKLYRAGYSGMAWPAEYGGRGRSIIEHFVVAEELGLAAAPEGINSIGREMAGPIILAAGTEAQKRHYVPRILGAEDVWCQGFSEPNAGSDLAALRTRAVREGDSWRINGQKTWTSYARFAQMCILLVRTDPDAPKHKGITLLLLDMKTPGITIRPLTQITGRQEFNELFLDDVIVPDINRLGAVNEGWRVANSVLSFERATNRLYRHGRFTHEFHDLLRRVAEQDPDFLSDAGRRREIGQIQADLMLLRARYLKVVADVSAGRDVGPEASLGKLQWSELHQRMASFAASAFGESFAWAGNGADRFQTLYLQSRAETIYAGTSQIQRNIIADRVLGLPR